MQTGIQVCRGCHKTIHNFASEKELGRNHYTFELLIAHEEIGKYVRWKQSKARLLEKADENTEQL